MSPSLVESPKVPAKKPLDKRIVIGLCLGAAVLLVLGAFVATVLGVGIYLARANTNPAQEAINTPTTALGTEVKGDETKKLATAKGLTLSYEKGRVSLNQDGSVACYDVRAVVSGNIAKDEKFGIFVLYEDGSGSFKAFVDREKVFQGPFKCYVAQMDAADPPLTLLLKNFDNNEVVAKVRVVWE